jgi:hypothetical protein
MAQLLAMVKPSNGVHPIAIKEMLYGLLYMLSISKKKFNIFFLSPIWGDHKRLVQSNGPWHLINI